MRMQKKALTLIRLICQYGFIEVFIIILDRLKFYMLYKWLYKLSFREYGNNIRFGIGGKYRCIPRNIHFNGIGLISLCDNIKIEDGVCISCHHNGQGVEIKSNVRINFNTHIEAYSKISILDAALIAPYVLISSSKHIYTDSSKPISTQGSTFSGDITIGSGAWLCERSIILGGVNIGENTIIAANTTVLEDMPNGVLCIGYKGKKSKELYI